MQHSMWDDPAVRRRLQRLPSHLRHKALDQMCKLDDKETKQSLGQLEECRRILGMADGRRKTNTDGRPTLSLYKSGTLVFDLSPKPYKPPPKEELSDDEEKATTTDAGTDSSEEETDADQTDVEKGKNGKGVDQGKEEDEEEDSSDEESEPETVDKKDDTKHAKGKDEETDLEDDRDVKSRSSTKAEHEEKDKNGDTADKANETADDGEPANKDNEDDKEKKDDEDKATEDASVKSKEDSDKDETMEQTTENDKPEDENEDKRNPDDPNKENEARNDESDNDIAQSPTQQGDEPQSVTDDNQPPLDNANPEDNDPEDNAPEDNVPDNDLPDDGFVTPVVGGFSDEPDVKKEDHVDVKAVPIVAYAPVSTDSQPPSAPMMDEDKEKEVKMILSAINNDPKEDEQTQAVQLSMVKKLLAKRERDGQPSKGLILDVVSAIYGDSGITDVQLQKQEQIIRSRMQQMNTAA